MMYYTHTISNTDGNNDVLFLCYAPDGGLKTFVADDDNTDYQNYLAWVAEGNEPKEWTGE